MKRTELKRVPLRSVRGPAAKRAKPLKKVRATKTSTLKNRATVLHSRYVRARDGACVRCGVTGDFAQLQCAHIISRRCAATRTDERNAATLCASCHRRLTEYPHEHVGFFTTWLGSWAAYQALLDKAESGLHKTMRGDFWEGEIERLRGLLEEQERQ